MQILHSAIMYLSDGTYIKVKCDVMWMQEGKLKIYITTKITQMHHSDCSEEERFEE